MLRQMCAETQGVEEGASAHHPVMASKLPRGVCKRIGRIGDGQKYRVWRSLHHRRNDLSKDFSVGSEKSQPAGRVVAIGGAACLFIDTCSYHNNHGTCEVLIVTCIDVDRRRKHSTVTNVRSHRFST